MSLLQEPLSHFLEELSSSSPTPGGGAAAALGGRARRWAHRYGGWPHPGETGA
jgi:hypothetical protein